MIYIVSGFFRSGTSMLMQGLDAGGLAVYYSRSRDAFNEANTDSTRRPNPKSLYEPSMGELSEPGFPRKHDGRAVKLLLMWLSSMSVHNYRVVVMKRDPEDIMKSYERNFHEYWDGVTRRKWITEYPARIEEAVRWFNNRKDVRSVVTLDFDEMINDPLSAFSKLYGWPIDAVKSACVVKQCQVA